MINQVTIYHNPLIVRTAKRPQDVSDGKPVKQATNHPKTRQKRAGSVFTACMVCAQVHSAEIHAIQPW